MGFIRAFKDFFFYTETYPIISTIRGTFNNVLFNINAAKLFLINFKEAPISFWWIRDSYHADDSHRNCMQSESLLSEPKLFNSKTKEILTAIFKVSEIILKGDPLGCCKLLCESQCQQDKIPRSASNVSKCRELSTCVEWPWRKFCDVHQSIGSTGKHSISQYSSNNNDIYYLITILYLQLIIPITEF